MSKRPQTAGRTELGRGVPPARRPGAGQIIEGRKAKAVDRWLDRLDGNAIRDRRPIQLSRAPSTSERSTSILAPAGTAMSTNPANPPAVCAAEAPVSPDDEGAPLPGVQAACEEFPCREAWVGAARRPGENGTMRMVLVVHRCTPYVFVMTEAISFDTHRFVKRLIDCGFTEQQAETLADEHVALLNGNLATKADLAAVKADLLKWLIGALIAQGGLIVALVKLL